jgi:hypothetical protein
MTDDVAQPGHGIVRGMAAAGGPVTTLATQANGFGVSDDGGTVFVFTLDAQVIAVPANGGASIVVADLAYNETLGAGGVAVAGTKVAFTASDFEIDVIDLAGGGVAHCGADPTTGSSSFDHCGRVARGYGDGQLAFGGDFLYWGGADHISHADVSASGGDAPERGEVLFLGFGPVRSLALASDSLFFWSSAEGCIERLGLAPGVRPVEVVCGNAPQSPIVVDERNIYWSTDDCRIAGGAALEVRPIHGLNERAN